MLLPNLLLVNCAGQLSVRVLPDLRSVDGGTIATRCTGALCLQERSLVNASIGQWPHGHARDSAVRICAAMHEHLLLLDVNDGAADAQVEPTRLRSKRFAKIGVAEPVDALLWRDQHPALPTLVATWYRCGLRHRDMARAPQLTRPSLTADDRGESNGAARHHRCHCFRRRCHHCRFVVAKPVESFWRQRRQQQEQQPADG